jgi:hypothetical protein
MNRCNGVTGVAHITGVNIKVRQSKRDASLSPSGTDTTTIYSGTAGVLANFTFARIQVISFGQINERVGRFIL